MSHKAVHSVPTKIDLLDSDFVFEELKSKLFWKIYEY